MGPCALRHATPIDPAGLRPAEQLSLLRQLVRTYALNFDWEQPTVAGLRFIDACMLCWTLDEIDSLDDLAVLDGRTAMAMIHVDNLFHSTDGYMGSFFTRFQRWTYFAGSQEWLSGLLDRCRGTKRGHPPGAADIAAWIDEAAAVNRHSLMRAGLIKAAASLTFYTTLGDTALTVGEIARDWPVPSTLHGACAYFESLFEFGHGYSSPEAAPTFAEEIRRSGTFRNLHHADEAEFLRYVARTWGAALVELRLEDILSWLDIRRPAGLTDETFSLEM